MLLTRTDVHRAVLPNPLAPDKDPMGNLHPFFVKLAVEVVFWKNAGDHMMKQADLVGGFNPFQY